MAGPKRQNKERQQVLTLVIVLGLILLVLGYFFRDKFLPGPQGEPIVLTPPTRMTVPAANGDQLYNRDDFKNLRRHDEIPVRPLETDGSADPFFVEKPVAQ